MTHSLTIEKGKRRFQCGDSFTVVLLSDFSDRQLCGMFSIQCKEGLKDIGSKDHIINSLTPLAENKLLLLLSCFCGLVI